MLISHIHRISLTKFCVKCWKEENIIFPFLRVLGQYKEEMAKMVQYKAGCAYGWELSEFVERGVLLAK